MERFDALAADRFAHSRPLRALSYIGGFSAIAALDSTEINDGEMGRIRAKQIDAVTQLVPVTMTVNLINMAIILVLFWNTGSNVFLSLWALAIASAVAMAVRSWLRSRRVPPVRASLRAARRMVLQAFFLAAIWGALPLVLLAKSDPTDQMIIACLMAGMISGGAFTLSTVPRAGLVYTWTMTFASAGALLLSGDKVHLFTAIFLLLYAAFWLAAPLALLLVAAWYFRTAAAWEVEDESKPEWREGHAGFGLYDKNEWRHDMGDPDKP